MDAVALALLDDIAAFEATASDSDRSAAAERSIFSTPETTGVGHLFSAIDDVQAAANLIGAAPASATASRDATPRARTFSIIGDDRAARLWSLGLSAGCAPVLTANLG